MTSRRFRVSAVVAIATAAIGAEVGPMGPDAPAREPQLAVNGSTIALTFGAGNSIYFTQSRDNGKSFATPVTVGSGALILLSHHRGPRIAFAGSALVITAVVSKPAAEGTQAHRSASKGDLMAWRSIDEGKTWSEGIVVNDVPGIADEALHGLAADGSGRLFSAWLDHRSGPPKLYGSLSRDGGLTWSPNVLVYASPDGTICQCCHPSVVFDGNGRILVMWRNSLGGSRDMYLASSNDGKTFAPAQKLGDGTWKLNACPMDGGGIAVDSGRVVTAWRREHSVLLDRPGEPEIEIGQGTDVAIAAGKSGAYAVWSTPGGIQLYSEQHRQARTLGEKGSFPAVAALPAGGAIVAWENDGKIIARRVD